jgi:hypothetical protein
VSADELPVLARRCWGALETLHVVGYFAPEPRAAYKELGLRGRHGYFAARSAAFGPVPAEVTTATFYVFAPRAVADALPAAWHVASPGTVLAARHRGVVQALHRVLDDVAAENDVREALTLARVACEGLSAAGRPLYAAHASLPEPEDPLLALWHAASLVREHRGDGHVAALLLAGLDPVEAIVTGGLANGTTQFMKLTRGWTEGEWAAAEERLRDQGLLDADGGLTPQGTELRAEVEAVTERLALPGWEHLGVERAGRLLELLRPMRRALIEADDVFPPGLFRSRSG